MHQLHVIGIGLEGVGGLSPAAQAQLSQASVMVGSAAHLALVPPDYAKPDGAERIPLAGSVDSWFETVATRLTQSSVVLLASGDPLFFGIGRLLLGIFPREQLAFYPHLSSVQLAFNRIGVAWQDAQIISLHGRDSEALDQAIKQGKSPIALLTDPVHTPAAIACQILDLHSPKVYRIWVCSRLGAVDEKVIAADPIEVQTQTFAEPLVVVLQALPDPEPLPARVPQFGIPDSWFHTYPDQPGLMTKLEIRIQILGLLQLPQSGILWDIGSGTGSIAVEMARLVPQGQVYAIEKRAAGIHLIQQNRDRFGLSNLEIINGKAPEALAALPDPYRVVMGGGGHDLGAILRVVQHRLLPGGILVASFATLDAATQGIQQVTHWGWSPQLLQVNLARSVAIAGSTRLSPLNPVMLLSAQKPAHL
ncbi:MAG: precorrin-6y C5,15-methyltransferase (decarboxylating) subunit CbiE [Synechococcaceae cyanobacterium SM2_3_2]|nr:precorrin-6y C5,15-methyltransferase (decarboxylating) subunit CbiE [Synechococcaceae cyanobacterium SM2_3_2]